MSIHEIARFDARRSGKQAVPQGRGRLIRTLSIAGMVALVMAVLAGCPSTLPLDDDDGDDAGNISVTGITLPESSVTLETGTTYQIEPEVAPSDATDTSVTFESSDSSVAGVDSNGLVTASSVGTATVTVTTTDGSFTADLVATVTAEITITGQTNAPAGWTAMALDSQYEELGIGNVSSGSPNTYTIVVPDSGTDYDASIAFLSDPVDPDGTMFFQYSSGLTVTTGTTELSGPDLFADVVVSNVDTTYAGRSTFLSVLDTGTGAEVAAGFGTVTTAGTVFIPELISNTSDTLWNDGTTGSSYDLWLGLWHSESEAAPDGTFAAEYFVTGSGGSGFASISTTSTGDPPQSTSVDATGAEYNYVPIIDTVNIYDTTAGEFAGRDLSLEIYAAGADPGNDNPEATRIGHVGSHGFTDGARFFSFTPTSPGSDIWFPTDTTYDVYLRVYPSSDRTWSGTPEILVAGSSTLPDPLGQFTAPSFTNPITIDVDASGTFN